jgi:hypothetical protein
VHRQYNAQSGQAIAAHIERSLPAVEKNSLDLYEGRISWGDFNKRKKESATQSEAEGQKVARAGT